MPTVKIETANIIQAHKKTDKDGKTLLENLFKGQVDFDTQITDRVKTFEDACEELGLDADTVLPYPNPSNNKQEAARAFAMLDIISEALAEGVVLNWEDDTQKKWYPWFNNYESGSGFRFDESDCSWAYTNSIGGARLCLPTKELSDYFGQQFLPVWNKFLNPTK